MFIQYLYRIFVITITTTIQIYTNMETLTTTQFQNYIGSLEIVHECGYSYAQDEVGSICSINMTEQEVEFADYAIIDGVEYELTEKQEELIANLTEGAIEVEDAPEEISSFEFYNNIYN